MTSASFFKTALGWMGFARTDLGVCRLVFGHPDRASAEQALQAGAGRDAQPFAWDGLLDPRQDPLSQRLTAFAAGAADDFLDVPLDEPYHSPFRKQVADLCRQIPLGETRTYAELAVLAGSPGAARAVGNVMATNPLPLLIPCHRVVGSNGSFGGYSAPGGLTTKKKLLVQERQQVTV